jgi:uncharacterized membrane protein YkgB
MESFMKADIFFFISSIGTIVLMALLAAALIYLVKFLKKVNKISDTVQDGIERLEEKVTDQPFLSFLFKKKKKPTNKKSQ